mgnify:CR=1 FL=1
MTWELLTLVDSTALSTNIRNWLEVIIIIWWFTWVFIYFLSPKIKMYASLYKNLSKKIYILLPDSREDYMNEEEKILKNSIFPKKNIEILKWYNKLSNLDDSSLVVVYYSPEKIANDIEQNIIWRAKSKKIPVIFYSKWVDNKVTNEHCDLIMANDYLINNTLYRLLSDMYAIMSLYNNK